MFVSISDLQIRDLEFDLEIKPGIIEFLDDQVVQDTAMKTTGTVHYRSSTREILVRGSLTVTVSFPCDRCLEKVERPIRLTFDLAYLPDDASPVEVEREVGSGEIDLAFYQNGGLELVDVLREQILLDLPMRRVCEPECGKAALPESAKDSEVRDPRWSALKAYRPAGTTNRE